MLRRGLLCKNTQTYVCIKLQASKIDVSEMICFGVLFLLSSMANLTGEEQKRKRGYRVKYVMKIMKHK